MIIMDNFSIKFFRCFIILYSVNFNSFSSAVPNGTAELDWWQSTIIYQVYPRSFSDSDGDGIGDLKGIEQMADYFAEIGIGAVWLNPIYKSPMADFGYDISDYKGIYEKFGTVDDLKSLKKKLNSMGIKLILDFVPNHTSDESDWFKKSVKKIEPYTDYYVWKDPKGWQDNKPIPPNNWISIFNLKPAWTYNEERKQFYLHQFLSKQPDINYRSEALRKEMEDVIKFWLEAGIDGFRIDAVPYLVEDENFPDEPYIDPNVPKNEYENLNHIYTKDHPMTFEIIRSWRQLLDGFTTSRKVDSRVMLTEAYTDLKTTMKYYGTEDKPISQMPFNFQLITEISPQSNAKDVVKSIQDWYKYMPEGKWPNWVVDNHDNFRVSSRYGSDMVDALNIIVTLLPGTAIIYYGDEIGMEDTFIRWDQTKDPAGIVLGKDKYLTVTRDACRTPMQWNDSLSAGFSTTANTWLPVNPNFWRINVEAQRKEEKSHLKVFKSLAAARKFDTIRYGDFKIHTQGDWTLIFTRTLANNPTFVIIVNMATEAVEPDLSALGINLPKELHVYTASINSVYKHGDKLGTGPKSFYLRPKTALVLTSEHVHPHPSPKPSSAVTLTSSVTSILSVLLLKRFF